MHISQLAWQRCGLACAARERAPLLPAAAKLAAEYASAAQGYGGGGAGTGSSGYDTGYGSSRAFDASYETPSSYGAGGSSGQKRSSAGGAAGGSGDYYGQVSDHSAQSKQPSSAWP